jgi:molybdenum cofactor biosynthesis protein B
MVDFQSRDTNRGLAEEDEGETAGESPAEDATGEDVVAVIPTSDAGTDVSDPIADVLETAGYSTLARGRRAEDLDVIQSAVNEFVDRGEVCAIVTVGGTGVAPTDRTVEAVEPLFTKALPGVGETFRREWDGDAIGCRVGAGIADGTVVFCLPGDADAARFAARELVAPAAAAIHREAAGE